MNSEMPSQASRPTDVFISYVQADRAWAQWIAEVLRADGISVVTGEDVIKPGASIETSLKRSVSAARTLLVVLSEGASGSPWVSAEVALARASGRPITAVRVDPRGVLADLAGVQIVDLVGLPLEEARQRLSKLPTRKRESGSESIPYWRSHMELPETFVDRQREL
jgi:hypothetical protein